MEVSSLVHSVTANADKLGTLAGFLVGTPNGINDLISSIEGVTKGNIHVPDVQAAFGSLMAEGNVTKGITGGIAGYVIDALNLPYVGKYGKAIEKLGIGYAVGAILIKMLWMSTHADLGSDPTKKGYNPSWWMNGNTGNSGSIGNRGYAY